MASSNTIESNVDPELHLKQIKNNRTQLKGELTRFQTFLNKFVSSGQVLETLQIRIEDIKPILDKFKAIQTQYEELLLSKFPDRFNDIDSNDEREEFESRYYESLALARKIVNEHLRDLTNSARSSEAQPQVSGDSESIIYRFPRSLDETPLPNVSTKLPLLKVPEFTGNYSDWQRFSDMFKAIVHNNTALPDVTKFYYLESALKGEPKDLIGSLAPTEGNYNIAWDLLQQRYENKKIIINSHIKEIMDIPTLSKESHVSLRNFSNVFFKSYRSLESLGVNVKEWSVILIYILVSKLDSSTRREWETFCREIELPQIEQFNSFLIQRCQLLEAIDTKSLLPAPIKRLSESKSLLVTDNRPHLPKCPNCKEQHFIYHCEKFKQLSVNDRVNRVSRLNLCSNCLRYGHKSLDCRSSGCKICKRKHATLLHFSDSKNIQSSTGHSSPSDSSLEQNSNKNQSVNTVFVTNDEEPITELNLEVPIANSSANPFTVMSNSYQNSTKEFILLSTAIVNVVDKDGNILPCRVLLDSASQSNFVTSSLVEKLKLTPSKIHVPIVGINQVKMNISESVDIDMSSQHTKYKVRLKCLVLPTISGLCPSERFDASKLKILPNLPLADGNFNIPDEIDMLLGCKVFFELLCAEQIKLGRNLPTMQNTLLGWVVAGQVPYGKTGKGKSDVMLSNCFFSQNSLHNDLERFWAVEEIAFNPRSVMSQEEYECESYFVKTTVRDENGRFIVKLPLKDNFNRLGESEQTALNRLYAIERRLSKKRELGKSYKAFMDDYEKLGHMSEISMKTSSDIQSKPPIYYIPHHCVEKPESTTTKLRVVFDAACKTATGLSLNNVLKVGPTIQEDLFSILIRFRKHSVVLVGDLSKMYRQILISEDERDLQRILWRNSPSEEVRHFQLNTVTYGTASASFLATRCLLQIANDVAENSRAESDIIRSDFYVDDLLTGDANVDSLRQLKLSICDILLSYGFELRKLQSNDARVLGDADRGVHDHSKYSISNDLCVKTLGVSWLPGVDMFEYDSQNPVLDHKITKRSILSFIAKMYDPYGILGPIGIRSKLIIQKLWQLRIDWDDDIPKDLASEWIELKHEISQVGQMRIPRHALVKEPRIIEMHGFSDASERAYGCCIFLRSIDADGHIESHLLCAKSRVSPLKVLSLPRLELLGALLLSRLFAKCVEALKLNISQTFLWTDSTIVLCWIGNEPKAWKTFVANRVAEIQQHTRVNDWYYISSNENPADIISRGSSLKGLVNSQLWLHGPQFLLKPSQWPKRSNISYFTKLNSPVPEIRALVIVQDANVHFDIFEKFSSLNRLIRVTAYCLRFIANCSVNREKRQTNSLTITEIETSTITLVKLLQLEAFANEIYFLRKGKCVSPQSKLKTLSPFLDDSGLIRVGGRLRNANFNYCIKHPIVLPAKHIFTHLVIASEHERTLHSGAQCTLSHVRQKYWPINGKQVVRSYVRKCVTCARVNPNVNIPPRMGDLPRARVAPSRPFSSVAVDYAGPFELKASQTRTNKLVKCYVCIFVCLVTKAVHIEVISDLTSEGFLSLLKRFVSRRGFSENIYTDNATNFVGTNNELISIRNLIQNDVNQKYFTQFKITWHFMPARSPHFGGLHEAAVKSCKHHLKRVLNGTHLHYESFYTLITQIEAILNSRPLISLSPDPEDLEALTPAHFLIGEQLTAIPERDLTGSRTNFVKHYRHLQQIKQHFWRRWNKEYVHSLQVRNKWQADKNASIPVGAMVLLKEDNVPPMCWPLGRIITAHPGKDNVTRVVSVKTKGGVVKRAINRLALLPVQVQQDNVLDEEKSY